MADDDENRNLQLPQNGSQREQEKSPETENQYSAFDRWVLLHFFTFFSFSFFVGIVIIHSSLLWHRYQSSNDDFLSTLMTHYYGIDYSTVNNYDTVVNLTVTSS